MKTYIYLFKHISLFFLISFIIITLSCSDDPSSPEKEKPIDAIAIGVEGGTIEKGDIKITIPAGAFDGNYIISVSEVADDGAFGENNISEIYKIDGLPDKFTSTLRVSIKYSGQLTGESYIAFGVENLENTLYDSVVTYTLFQASDSAGYVITDLALNTNISLQKFSKTASSNAYKYRGYLRAIHRMNTYNTDHFEIKYPRELENSRVLELAINLEEIHNIVSTDLNFRLDQLPKPIIVSTQYRGTYASRGFDNSINIGNKYITNGNFSNISKSLGSELIKIGINRIFDPYERFGLQNPDYSWLEIAILSWSEELFTLDESFEYPLYFNLDYMSPFGGLRAGAGPDNTFIDETIYGHGVGMSSLIKYMIENDKIKKVDIVKIFHDIANGSSPTSALIQNIDGNVTDWWSDFFKKYVMGDFYTLSLNDFIAEAENEWNINNNEDKEKIFSITESPDLSATLFKINLNYSEFDNSQKLLLNMSSLNNNNGLSLIIFSIDKDNNANYIGTSREVGVELADLKGYYDLGIKQFLAVLVNSKITQDDYLGQSDIDLEMKITTKGNGGESDLKYNRCFIEVYLVADLYDTRFAEEYEHYTSPIRLGTQNEYDSEIRSIGGNFTGNTFTGTYIGTNDREGQSSTVTVILNETHDLILEYSWAEVDNSLADLANPIRSVSGVSGVNIPINQTKEGYFELRGANACSGVSTLLNFTEWEKEQFGTVRLDSSTVEGFNCDENSRVIIEFSEE
jgi:hypothetical protein